MLRAMAPPLLASAGVILLMLSDLPPVVVFALMAVVLAWGLYASFN